MRDVKGGFLALIACLVGTLLGFWFMARGGVGFVADDAQRIFSLTFIGLMFCFAIAASSVAWMFRETKLRTPAVLISAVTILLFLQLFVSFLAVMVIKQ